MHDIQAKAILSSQNGMNIYRGCTHGCIYCDSRSACYQMDHAFEDVAVKRNAPELLEDALRRKRRRCMIGTGSMCDPYLPLEAETRLTRRCLEIIARQGFGVSVLTKSDMILRDIDLLKRINDQSKAVVCTTFTTFDENLCRVLEPNVCTTRRRLEMLQTMRKAGIHTGVWIGPILPFLNDTEENLQYFYAQLDRHFPGMKSRYIRSFGSSYECLSPNAACLTSMLRSFCRAHGILCGTKAAMAWLMEFEDKQAGFQIDLFS